MIRLEVTVQKLESGLLIQIDKLARADATELEAKIVNGLETHLYAKVKKAHEKTKGMKLVKKFIGETEDQIEKNT